MQKIVPALIITGTLIVAGWLVWGSINPAARPSIPTATTTPESFPGIFECDADAKMCPDGSAVGRTGPNCEFATCPSPETTSAVIRTTMGQKMKGLNVTITPSAVLDDSRCPADVQCIWAGTVKVRVTIQTPGSLSEETIEIGHTIKKDGYTIMFTELSPQPRSGETIPESSYQFVFSVSSV